MFPRAVQAVSNLSQQSTRRLVLANNITAQPSSSLAPRSTTVTSNQCTFVIKPRLYHSGTSAVRLSPSTSSSLFAIDTTSTLRSLLHTRSISTTRSSAQQTFSTQSAWSFHKQQQSSRTPFVSRKYTSSSSPSSSSSSSSTSTTAAGSAARILAEESSSQAASTAASSAGAFKTPLSFHEEMTKVRFSFSWWKEWTIVMGVFAVTGSSTVMVVRPLLKEVFSLEGSWREGPWSFRIAYLCTTLPLYSSVLLTVATLAGRRPYFMKVVLRMWGRFLPKKALQRFQ
ncbi:hypothetical protein EDD21DRAFT_379971 [Dissophora ornata]|nr:hypothetical protein EDD21DRAFT_379971 [Dissophora ornata]